MSVLVYCAPIRSISDAEYEHLRVGLPEFQQHRFNIKRPGSLFAWCLLKEVVKSIWGFETLPECIKPESGKPYFAKYPDIHFSLSHNDYFAVCAVSDKPVGCDIESVSRKPAKVLLDKVLTSDEKELVLTSRDFDKAFMKIWTLKEAKLKKEGTGLAGGIGKTDVADIFFGNMVRSESGEYFSVFEHEGNHISVCASDFASDILEIKI
ncbi:MAG: 4'-phosphopantetheinyl transferase superfamily protein [Ruminococcaceae bacterium]|nr:4'-phosphopantetheinyl transferase superfamily protein [Oscillospiraceae bacterium]